MGEPPDHLRTITLESGVTGVRIVAWMTDCPDPSIRQLFRRNHHQAPVCDQRSSIPVAVCSVCQSEQWLLVLTRLRNAVSAPGKPQGLLVVWPWFQNVDRWLGHALKTLNFISYYPIIHCLGPPQHSRDKSILAKPDLSDRKIMAVCLSHSTFIL